VNCELEERRTKGLHLVPIATKTSAIRIKKKSHDSMSPGRDSNAATSEYKLEFFFIFVSPCAIIIKHVSILQ
jgi:hypothetical protein